jgi:predicted nucleotidyltransferase
MRDQPAFAIRRNALLDRIVTLFSSDPRFPAGWLEGSLADGSADSYSDIDLHLYVADDAWDEVWTQRKTMVENSAPVLVSTDIVGAFAVALLMEGPVKLDVFYERRSNLASRRRVALKRLWGPEDIYRQLKLGEDLGANEIARALEYNVLGFLQGATWPVRMLARGQLKTFLFNEILLIETAILPLMLLRRDRRTFHRNMFTRAKMLNAHEHGEYVRLIEEITGAVQSNDRVAMRKIHIEIFREICRLAREAFASYNLNFPPRVEQELVAFFNREWPMT